MIAGDLALKRRINPTRSQWMRAMLIDTFFALALVLIFSFQSIQEPIRLEAGQVSPQTIRSPERMTFASQLQTNEARLKAESEVKDVYDPPNPELVRLQVKTASRIFDFVDSVRHDTYSSNDRKIELLQAISKPALATAILSRTLTIDEEIYHRIVSETLYVVDVTMRDEIHPADLPAQYVKIPSRISLALSSEQADLVTQWAQVFIVPNSMLNEKKTQEQRNQARDRVGSVYRTIEQGQVIVREGEIAKSLDIEALEAIGVLHPTLSLGDYVGPSLYAILIVVLLSFYLFHLRPALATFPRAIWLIAFLIVSFAVGIRILSSTPLLLYLLPISAAVMLLAVLLDSEIALGAGVVLALTIGYFAPNSLEFTLITLASTIVASMTLGRIERLQAFLWSGAFVAIANAAVVAIFQVLSGKQDATTWVPIFLSAAGNGALSGLLALGSLFALGKLFGITTPLELLDLARPTHPLLQKLLLEAPGTYHHSLIVSQLAEQGAHRIGADALLVRVGAYYHDIGKTREPQSFVENQLDGINIHDTLEPSNSALIVIAHVQGGIMLGKRYGLPGRLLEFIPQHHGTTLTTYFHRKAMKASGNATINDQHYRYPGPKPQTREAAILMLADGVEATTRAERPTSSEQIRIIIDRIFNERLRDGQLDESELTLRDLEQIKDAFVGVLQGLFHPRVKYPDAPVPPPPESIKS